jgi:TonB-dependent SusC/RagA subfamily outer membrane receptor
MEMTTEMNEVVITALGIPRDKKAVGYATQKVEGSNVSTARETNVVNALQGKVAGVQITGSSNLGGSSRILMRGIKSVYGNNQPLFVVDGVPIENGNYTTADQARSALGYDYGNAIQDIDPSNIEDVQFLKGPAAALYGSRGANGVVLITTKKGKATGKGAGGIGVTVTENYGFDKVYVLPDYQNIYGGGAAEFDSSAQFPGLLVHDYFTDASWGPKMEGQPVLQWYAFDQRYHPDLYGKATPWTAHPDNVKNFYKTGTTSNLNVSLDGATDRSTFRLSLSNLNQTGTFENSSLKRNTLGFNGTHRFNDKLMAGTSVNVITSKGKGRPQPGYNNLSSNFTQWFQRQLDFTELQDYKNPDGSQRSWNRSAEDDASIPFWDNPY